MHARPTVPRNPPGAVKEFIWRFGGSKVHPQEDTIPPFLCATVLVERKLRTSQAEPILQGGCQRERHVNKKFLPGLFHHYSQKTTSPIFLSPDERLDVEI